MLGYNVQSFRTVYYRKSLLNTYTNNEIPITGFIPPHSCTCPKPGPGSPISRFFTKSNYMVISSNSNNINDACNLYPFPTYSGYKILIRYQYSTLSKINVLFQNILIGFARQISEPLSK
jgi:hypothetical protein